MRRRFQGDPEETPEGPSKTQVKQAMHDLQDLGVGLLDLTDDALDALAMDGRLRDALRELRRIDSHEARRRQAQYVGKLLRDADVEPLRQALAAQRAGRAQDARAQRAIEDWRERVLADDAGLAAWLAAHPQSDTPAFFALVRDARREASAPDGGQRRAYRELYRGIAAVLKAG